MIGEHFASVPGQRPVKFAGLGDAIEFTMRRCGPRINLRSKNFSVEMAFQPSAPRIIDSSPFCRYPSNVRH